MVVLNYHNIEKYLKNRFLLCKDESGSKIVVIFDPSDLVYLPNSLHSYNIKLLTKQEFYDLLEQNFSHFNIIKAKYLLDFVSPQYTAKNIDFAKVAIGVNILFFATLIKYTLFFHIINHLTYFAQNILKTVLFSAKIGANDNDTKLIELPISYKEDFLPIYTILIPLYKEVEKLDSILLAMEDLLYPKHKLDVKLILESDDYLLIDLIKSKNLPIYIHVIITPLSFPRTKPKALNYAMNYVIGEYVTIYDAEDRPEPNQLLKAVTMFQSLPRNYACVQAKLSMYNSESNILTKLFTIEYSIWFEYLLHGLSILKYPVPLGGTSNHFKTNILRSIGGWDAYNVTEDAELGMRLYLRGYKSYILNSYTFEEAPISFSIWLNQRARWIKGFFQTFLIFRNNNKKSYRLTRMQIFVTYIFIGVSSYNFFCLPWLILMILNNTNNVMNYLWLVNSFFSFSYTYATAFYSIKAKKEKIQQFSLMDYIAIILYPFYSILHSIASYKAMFEIITNPFKWNKTPHGVVQKKK